MKIFDSMFGVKCPRCKDNRIGSNKQYCDDCQIQVLANEERKRACPVCQIEMVKKIWKNIITDKCAKCGGVWLDGGELEKVKEKVANSHSDDGFATGFIVGHFLG